MQEPKIVFLGTGGDPIVVGKQIKASGGIVIHVNDNQFHLDPGPGALTRAFEYGVNLRDTIGVLCSHNHINHCNDINAVIDAMTLSGMDRTGVVVASSSVVEGDENSLPYLTRHHKSCVEKTFVLEKGSRVGINNIEIKATTTKHNDPSCIGFRILTNEFNLGYTSDTGYVRELAEDFKGVDVLVLNVPYHNDNRQEFNLCTHDATRLVDETKPKLAIITHYGIKMIEADILNEARFIQRETKVQTIAAKDGMVINPISYSVNLRQKTLNLFQR